MKIETDTEYIYESLAQFDNYLIPDLRIILTNHIGHHYSNELHNQFKEKIDIDKLLLYIAENFDLALLDESTIITALINLTEKYLEEKHEFRKTK